MVAVIAAMMLAVATACAGETVEVPGETVVVDKEVIKTVEVPGETVVKEVIKEVMVPGETVIVKEEVVKTVEVPGETVTVEVVKEVMVPGETVVVEKEVIKTVEVPGETVVVEQEVVKTVEVVKEVPRGPVGDTTKVVGAFATIGSNLDPRADGHKPSGFPIFDPLLHMNQDHEVEPYLAASWEASPTLKQITFHLRDDAKFHTGDAVEARDIIQTIGIYWRDPSQDYARANDYKNNVVRLEAVDNLTLVLEMSMPAVDRLEFYTEKDPHHGLDHLTDRAQHVSQTLLLSHTRQSPRIVAPSSVGHHHSRIVRRHNLPDLLVAVTSAHLVHRSIIGLECHQKGALTTHSPARVVGVDHRTLTHRTPQPPVCVSHRSLRASQSVLGDRALAQLHSGQRSEHGGYPPHRYAHSIVEHVSRSHHSSSHPMGARTVLVRPNVGMTPTYTC